MIFMQYREFQKNHKKYLQKSVDKSKFFGWLLEDIFCKPSKQKQGYLYIMEKLHLWVWFLTRKAVKNEKSSVVIIEELFSWNNQRGLQHEIKECYRNNRINHMKMKPPENGGLKNSKHGMVGVQIWNLPQTIHSL